MKKLYVIPVTATKACVEGTAVGSSACVVLASSEEEAMGCALKNCLEYFPESEGYQNHKVSYGADVIPDDLIRAAYAELPAKKARKQ